MSWLQRDRPYDRRRLLDRAGRAERRSGRRARERAIALYRQVLSEDPADTHVLRRLGRLLARDRQEEEALGMYHRATGSLVARGFADRAIGVYREATSAIPHDVSLWREMAKLEFARGSKAQALAVLLEGRNAMRHRRLRPRAIELLTLARYLEPKSFDINLDLAQQLARAGKRSRAYEVLEELLAAYPSQVRRIRARQFRIRPGPATAWRWLSRTVSPPSPGCESA